MGSPYQQDVTGSPTRVSGMAVVLALIALALFLLTIAAWRMGSSYGQQACVQKVLAKYPAVSVSAYDSARTTGSLKLSYDAERRKAVADC